jgi:hypothetical protein
MPRLGRPSFETPAFGGLLRMRRMKNATNQYLGFTE